MRNSIEYMRLLREQLNNTTLPISNIDFVQNLIESKNEEDLLGGLIVKNSNAHLPIPGFPEPGLSVARNYGPSFVSGGRTPLIVASDFDWLLEFVKLVEDSFIEAFDDLKVDFPIYRDFDRHGDKTSTTLRWSLQSKHPVIVRLYQKFTKDIRYTEINDNNNYSITYVESESGTVKITGYLDKARDKQRSFFNYYRPSKRWLRRNFSKYGRLELKNAIAYSLLDNPLDAKNNLNDEELKKRFFYRQGSGWRRR